MGTITIHPKNSEQLETLKIILKAMEIPFIANKEAETEYDPEFVAKIKQSQKDFKEGKGKKINLDELKSLWK